MTWLAARQCKLGLTSDAWHIFFAVTRTAPTPHAAQKTDTTDPVCAVRYAPLLFLVSANLARLPDASFTGAFTECESKSQLTMPLFSGTRQHPQGFAQYLKLLLLFCIDVMSCNVSSSIAANSGVFRHRSAMTFAHPLGQPRTQMWQ